jgi:P-type E1-E2 ATPase
VVFDKTGTLTRGTPELVAVRPEAGFGDDELLALVASAEQYSSHVLATAFVDAAHARGLPLHDVSGAEEQATHGVTARIMGREVVVGKFSFVADQARGASRTAIGAGELAVYVGVDGVFAGALLARDVVRTEAADTLARLRAWGIRDIRMLTGDARETAESIATPLGITDVRAECLPGDKVAEVTGVVDRPVVMVGDGVNDAPVLAAADVGIALGARGATAASESADAVILVDDVGRVADAVRIGRDTVRIALQSIWLGIIVSVALMVVATFGVIPATVGALLQEGIDLVTILAALRAIGPRGEDRPQSAKGQPVYASAR